MKALYRFWIVSVMVNLSEKPLKFCLQEPEEVSPQGSNKGGNKYKIVLKYLNIVNQIS